MKILCRVFGHQTGSNQVWANKVESVEPDGRWMQVRGFCPRCTAFVDLGLLFERDLSPAALRAMHTDWPPRHPQS